MAEPAARRIGTADPVGAHIRLLAGLALAGFGLLAGATLYWGFFQAEALDARPDNLRRVIADRAIQRGRILDRAGRVLAETKFASPDGPERVYPFPSSAPVVGYQTWQFGAGAIARATYGAGGAEAAYDLALRGEVGQGFGDVFATNVLHRPSRGRDVVLTLDAELQRYAAQLLGQREGAIVVLDVGSGAVRAMVSQPTFDPSQLDVDGTVSTAPARPLFNRATQGVYPPGSIWKAITLAGALAEGLVQPTDFVEDGDRVAYFAGFPVRCNNNPPGQTRFDIAHAFGWSCNVTFAELGTKLGEDRFRRHARAFGIGDAPPFALPTAAGSISTHSRMDAPELASASFGQGELEVSPLQMALVAATLAGDGSVPVPYLLQGVDGVDDGAFHEVRGTWRRAVPDYVAQSMRDVMAVAARDGWARSAADAAGIPVGGKTGTAQLAEGAPHAWFIGYAPTDAPRVAVAVLVVNGGDGASVAAPIGGRVLAEAVKGGE